MIAYELHPKQEFDALTRVERQPASLGPHDIRVRIRAVSLNYRDLNIARLAQRRPQGPKRIPTSDGAGEVVQVGGGVSIFTLQLAKAAGARVILTSSSEAKRQRARELGADHVIDYRATSNWGEAVQAWTGGQGVDVVVEVGGPGTFDQSVVALRYGGTMSLLGVLTGVRGEVNVYTLFQKGLHVRGVYVGSGRMFEALNRAMSANEIHPIVDRVFPFEEARAAYEYLASGAHFGKVVIRVNA